MILNCNQNFQFNTRLHLDENVLEEVKETRLLGVILTNNLTWQSNTASLVKRCYQRMLILKKLYKFSVPVEDLATSTACISGQLQSSPQLCGPHL